MSQTKIEKAIGCMDGSIKMLTQCVDYQTQSIEKIIKKLEESINKYSKISTKLQIALIFWTAIMALAIIVQIFVIIKY